MDSIGCYIVKIIKDFLEINNKRKIFIKFRSN